LRRMHDCRIGIMVFGSAGARAMPVEYDRSKARLQFLEAVRIAGDIAARYGITIVLEPILSVNCNIFNLVCEGSAFIDTLAHPQVKLLADLYHVAAGAEPYDHIIAAGARLYHVHLPTPAIPETGEGTAYDFSGFLAALQQAGYQGRMTVEDNPHLLGKVRAPYPQAIVAIRRFIESQYRID